MNDLSNKIIGSAIEVHKELGPGLLTYLKLSNLSLGYLMNFNVSLMKDGIRRVVNNHPNV